MPAENQQHRQRFKERLTAMTATRN